MLPSDITLDTNKVFSLITQRTNSSVRADAARPLDKPTSLTVAHETAKSGRVSSVIIFDTDEVIPCDASCNLTPSTDNLRIQLKLQYNPNSGRVDTAADIVRVKALLTELMADTNVWTRFVNRES